MSKLLILGAGISQLPLIAAAKKLGHYVIVLSRRGNYPGFALADEVYYEDTTNIEGVVEIAKLERIDGICTTGTDVAVQAIGKTVDAMGLSGLTCESAQLSTNKWKMKTAFSQHGVRTSKFIQVATREEAYRAFEALSPPLVFKALDSGASKGIVMVADASQVDYAYEEVMRESRLDYFIAEEFVEGIEFGAQAFVFDRHIQFVMPHGDMMFYGDAGVPIGHYVPYSLSEETAKDMRLQLERGIEALRLNNCAVNADFIVKDGLVYVLEIGGRAGATCLPELVSTYYGFDYYEQIIRAALGERPEFPASDLQPCACELLLADRPGRIVGLDNRNESHEHIIQVEFDYRIGDTIRAFRVGTDRIGQVVVKGDSLEGALRLLREVKESIHVELE